MSESSEVTSNLIDLIESCCVDFEKLGLGDLAKIYKEKLEEITCSLN